MLLFWLLACPVTAVLLHVALPLGSPLLGDMEAALAERERELLGAMPCHPNIVRLRGYVLCAC